MMSDFKIREKRRKRLHQKEKSKRRFVQEKNRNSEYLKEKAELENDARSDNSSTVSDV